MIRLLSFLIGLGVLSIPMIGWAAVYSREIRSALDAVGNEHMPDGKPLLEGYVLGYPGRIGEFFRRYPLLCGVATRGDVDQMIADKNPLVRLVGAKIDLSRGGRDFSQLKHDTAVVWVGPLLDRGKAFREMTVGEIVREMEYDPLFLQRWDTGSRVTVELLSPSGAQVSPLILGEPPTLPYELSRLGLNGDVIASVDFTKGTDPRVVILRASNDQFKEPCIRALSKWRIVRDAGKVDGQITIKVRIAFSDDDE